MADPNSSGVSAGTSPSMQARVERMFSGDRAWALALLVLLWVAVAIVYFGASSAVHNHGVSIALVVSAVLIVGYNTASVIAMIRHYSEDKRYIYEIDIRHLDRMKEKARRQS